VHIYSNSHLQALKIHKVLGWGLAQFDEKMSVWMANTKRQGKGGKNRKIPDDFLSPSDDQESTRKDSLGEGTTKKKTASRKDTTEKSKKKSKKKKKKKKRRANSSSEDGDSCTSSENGAKDFMPRGSKISVVGEANAAMAHGQMVDQEPELPGIYVSWYIYYVTYMYDTSTDMLTYTH
jgi:hypothetical protein